MTPGKLWSLRRIADRAGRFSLLAIDQRAAPAELVASRRAQLLDDPRLAPHAWEDIARLKRLLAAELSPHASGLLVDPGAYPLAMRSLDPSRGLLLTAEDTAYEDTPQGRRSVLYPGWSVAKIKRLGADAVKLRLWYRADAAPEICADQQRLVERIGQDCREHDIAFLLCPALYALGGAGGGDIPGTGVGDDAHEDAAVRPQLMLAAIEEFRHERYGVDLFKLETPLPPAAVPDPDAHDAEAIAAQQWFDRMDALLDRPWVMLSAGTTMEHFRRTLKFSFRSGASGFLGGRALWWRAAQEYPDWERVRWRLRSESLPYLEQTLALLAEWGRPYTSKPNIAPSHASADGPGFTERYGR